MIQIEDVEEIPELMWATTSAKEFHMMGKEAREELVRNSFPVKLARQNGKVLLVGGLLRQTFLSTPYLWMLLTEDFTKAPRSTFRLLVKLADQFIPSVETLVEEDNPSAKRLAALFKFLPTDDIILVGDKSYRMYRRRT